MTNKGYYPRENISAPGIERKRGKLVAGERKSHI